jgi:hypothetical protein
VLKNNKLIESQTEAVFYTPPAFIQVFPNPVVAGQPVNIVIASDEPTNVFIYDSLGRLARVVNESGAIKTIETAGLKPGIYVVRTKSQNGKYLAIRLVII